MYLLEPRTSFDDVVDAISEGRLPGLRIRHFFLAEPSDIDARARRLYRHGIRHALLEDGCKNTLWTTSAVDSQVDHGQARFVGEALFDHFGMQGRLEHFGNALSGWGRTLRICYVVKPDEELPDCFDWDKDNEQTCRRCRR